MSVSKRPGSPFWYARFMVNGKRVVRSTGTADKRRAQQIEAKWKLEAFDKQHLKLTPTKTLAEAVDRYQRTVIEPRGNPGSAAREAYVLKTLLKRLGPTTKLADITAPEIAAMRDALLSEGKAPATANRYLSAIKTILRRSAEDWGWLDHPPVIRLLPLNNARYRWLTDEEEQRLLVHAPTHLVDLIIFMIETGARLSEAVFLRWSEVDFERQPRPVVKFIKTKSKKPRGVPLSKRAEALLKSIRERTADVERGPEGEGRVFLYAPRGRGGRGEPSETYRAFYRPHGAWTQACRRAGFEDLHMHDLRHTFASRLAMRGVPIVTLSRLLGHASIQMTMRYAHLSPINLNDGSYVDRGFDCRQASTASGMIVIRLL